MRHLQISVAPEVLFHWLLLRGKGYGSLPGSCSFSGICSSQGRKNQQEGKGHSMNKHGKNCFHSVLSEFLSRSLYLKFPTGPTDSDFLQLMYLAQNCVTL